MTGPKELDEVLLLAVLCGGGRDVPFDRILLAVEHRTGVRLDRLAARRVLGRLCRGGRVSARRNGEEPRRRGRSMPVFSLESAGERHLRRVLWTLDAMTRGTQDKLLGSSHPGPGAGVRQR